MNTNRLSRRNFFKTSALSIGGLMASRLLKAGNQTKIVKNNTILYRTLGKTGIKVPIISSGSIKKDNPNLVKAAIEAGVMHFDTARGYENGENEKMLGEAIKGFDREKLVIGTKVKGETDKEGFFLENVTVDTCMESINASLESLHLDYVDILYTHAVKRKEAVLYEPMLEALKKAKEQGKARFIGVTTHTNMAEVINSAVECGEYDVVLTSYNYQYKEGSDVEQAIKRAAEAGMGIIGMKSQAGKFLDKERQKPVNSIAAIKYVLNNPNMHTLLVSVKSYEQLMEYMAIMDNLEMTNEEINELNSYSLEGSIYCLGCEDCIAQCPKRLPIPDLMRAYMYTYGYTELSKGYEVVKSLDLADNPCNDCTVCTVNCRNGFQVAQKVKDIVRLREVPWEFIS
ncbi:MAG: aldo/keto reductase [Bacteroidales bacterium]|nr:aldo/keto reductase [Bacteroidales bacterium]